jgi:hypothetical protein
MTKPVRSLMMAAAVAGILAGTNAVAQDNTGSGTSSQTQTDMGGKKDHKKMKMEKHACKGQNSCKGNGGCKAGDNGCKGKNSCKGKGGCATDGSKKQ